MVNPHREGKTQKKEMDGRHFFLLGPIVEIMGA